MSDVREPSDEAGSPASLPDYELAAEVRADTPAQLKALANPVRNAILHLVVERAATAGELATAVGRSHGTIAHHLNVLADAGLVRVVRTRKVRAVTERYWGRTGRTILIAKPPGRSDDDDLFFIHEALRTFEPDDDGHGYTTLRYARIDPDRAHAFARRLDDLVQEFLQQPRAGDTTYGLLVALQPTGEPALADAPGDDTPGGTTDDDGDPDADG